MSIEHGTVVPTAGEGSIRRSYDEVGMVSLRTKLKALGWERGVQAKLSYSMDHENRDRAPTGLWLCRRIQTKRCC